MRIPKLMAAILGAVLFGAMSIAAKKGRQQKPSKVAPDDISRWEGEGGSPVPKPNQKI